MSSDSTGRTYREQVISRTSRRYIEVREAECTECGETVSRALDTRTFEWDTLPDRCWSCGAPTPWEQGLDPEFEERNDRSVDTGNERSEGVDER